MKFTSIFTAIVLFSAAGTQAREIYFPRVGIEGVYFARRGLDKAVRWGLGGSQS